MSGKLRARLSGFRVKEKDEEIAVDVALSLPLQQDDGPIDLIWLGELAGKRVIVSIESEQKALPLKPRSTGTGS